MDGLCCLGLTILFWPGMESLGSASLGNAHNLYTIASKKKRQKQQNMYAHSKLNNFAKKELKKKRKTQIAKSHKGE